MSKFKKLAEFDVVHYMVMEMAWYGEKAAQVIARPFLEGNKLIKFIIE